MLCKGSIFPPTLQMGKLRHRASKILPWPPAKIKPRHPDSRAGHSAPPPFDLHESLSLVGCLSGLTREGKCLPKITQQTRDRMGDSVSLSSKLRTTYSSGLLEWKMGQGGQVSSLGGPINHSLPCLSPHPQPSPEPA